MTVLVHMSCAYSERNAVLALAHPLCELVYFLLENFWRIKVLLSLTGCTSSVCHDMSRKSDCIFKC